MKSTIFSKKDLADMLDECIKDVRGKSGTKLVTRGNLFRILRDSTKNDALAVLSVPFATLGNQLSWVGITPAVGMLPPDVRQKYDKLIDETCRESVAALEKLKTELCLRDRERPEELLKIVSKLDRMWIRLSEEVNVISQAVPQP